MTRTGEGKHCSLGTTDSGMAPGVMKWRRPTQSPAGLLDVKSRAHRLPTPDEGPDDSMGEKSMDARSRPSV